MYPPIQPAPFPPSFRTQPAAPRGAGGSGGGSGGGVPVLLPPGDYKAICLAWQAACPGTPAERNKQLAKRLKARRRANGRAGVICGLWAARGDGGGGGEDHASPIMMRMVQSERRVVACGARRGGPACLQSACHVRVAGGGTILSILAGRRSLTVSSTPARVLMDVAARRGHTMWWQPCATGGGCGWVGEWLRSAPAFRARSRCGGRRPGLMPCPCTPPSRRAALVHLCAQDAAAGDPWAYDLMKQDAKGYM